ncbi:MAG TPA: hypothetical protein P5279_02450 [Anaerohalosphaeraceae bacterium]|jgi:hypothetical protein|nr:hypothetical protein [Anaerohalosphaeraceae bacterium]HRT49330.1 hypothetical protein [Anaerohalosphaeraceae bacterium]HRT85941.1 hypothetical protein [Anaerohalosphaeraceae bacterium]
MARVWPIICQFGVGAALCLLGIVCGVRGRYFDLRLPEDRRFLAVVIAGFLGLLALAIFFTFVAPSWSNGVMP